MRLRQEGLLWKDFSAKIKGQNSGRLSQKTYSVEIVAVCGWRLSTRLEYERNRTARGAKGQTAYMAPDKPQAPVLLPLAR